MKLDDLELKRHYERAVSVISGVPDDEMPIFGLMSAYDWFSLTDGQDSPRVQEIIRLLSSPELRAPLKSWYLRCGALNTGLDEFRKTLEQAIGEKLPLTKSTAQRVAQAVALIESEGGEVLCSETMVDAGDVRARPDLFIRNADGSHSFVEVKTGEWRALATQARVSQIIRQGGAVPAGDNALRTRVLQPGVPVAAAPVRVIVFP